MMLSLLFNLAEAFWWMGLGVWVLLSKNLLAKHHYKITLSIVLIFFGISDFVEMTTGAWWRPHWLLAWKVLCVIIGLILIILIFVKGDTNEDKS